MMPRFRVFHQTTIEREWIVEAPDAGSAEQAARLAIGYGVIGDFDGYPELPDGWEYTEVDESYRAEDGAEQPSDLVADESGNEGQPLTVRRP